MLCEVLARIYISIGAAHSVGTIRKNKLGVLQIVVAAGDTVAWSACVSPRQTRGDDDAAWILRIV